jgi:hypothetical protein
VSAVAVPAAPPVGVNAAHARPGQAAARPGPQWWGWRGGLGGVDSIIGRSKRQGISWWVWAECGACDAWRQMEFPEMKGRDFAYDREDSDEEDHGEDAPAQRQGKGKGAKG